jgi:hypothetical protein
MIAQNASEFELLSEIKGSYPYDLNENSLADFFSLRK